MAAKNNNNAIGVADIGVRASRAHRKYQHELISAGGRRIAAQRRDAARASGSGKMAMMGGAAPARHAALSRQMGMRCMIFLAVRQDKKRVHAVRRCVTSPHNAPLSLRAWRARSVLIRTVVVRGRATTHTLLAISERVVLRTRTTGRELKRTACCLA